MPQLSEADRKAVFEEVVSKNQYSEIDSLQGEDLIAVIDAIDDWILANQASFNAALPQPARGLLTGRQKAWLFSLIIRRRWRMNA